MQGYIMKKYHYVYEITYADSRKYIGVRSCDCSIEEDSYMGSPFHLPSELVGTGVKEVLSTHTTRQEAMLEEIRLHAELDVKNNSNYINQCNATSVKFQVSREAHQRSANTRRGRTKHTHEYIQKQVEARAEYRGEGLTPAQKAQWDEERKPERMKKYFETLAKTMEDPYKAQKIKEARVRGGKSCKGIKNPKKALPGLKHGRAKPWYYTDTQGNTIEVMNSVRGFFRENPDTLPFTQDRVMAYLREGTPKKLRDLGWDFGYLAGE